MFTWIKNLFTLSPEKRQKRKRIKALRKRSRKRRARERELFIQRRYRLNGGKKRTGFYLAIGPFSI
ncbi:hypothetical protein AWENTII_008797 [Aspergillus wentii]